MKNENLPESGKAFTNAPRSTVRDPYLSYSMDKSIIPQRIPDEKARAHLLRDIPIPPETVALGDEINQRYWRIYKIYWHLDSAAQRRAFKQQQRDLAKRVAEGTKGAEKAFLDADVFTPQDFTVDAEVKRRALRNVIREISDQARCLLKPITAEVRRLAVQKRDELRAHEEEECNAAGVPWRPSNACLMYHQIANTGDEWIIGAEYTATNPQTAFLRLGVRLPSFVEPEAAPAPPDYAAYAKACAERDKVLAEVGLQTQKQRAEELKPVNEHHAAVREARAARKK